MLNSSLNVSRKKKHRLTAEQEEELRRKQESLFQKDQSSTMNTVTAQSTDPKSQTATPTFPSAGLPTYQPQVPQPNNPKFYDGSITQVLQNPLPNAGIPMPTSSFPTLGAQKPQPAPENIKPMSGLGVVAQPQVTEEKPPAPIQVAKGIYLIGFTTLIFSSIFKFLILFRSFSRRFAQASSSTSPRSPRKEWRISTCCGSRTQK